MKNNGESYRSVMETLRVLNKNILITESEELVPVFESCGRTIKNNIFASHDVPPFNTSHMDGFAVNSEDTINATHANPVLLKISKFDSTPGRPPHHRLKLKEAYPVQTGGYLPIHADSVIPVEKIELVGTRFIKVMYPFKKGTFVFLKGSDFKKGTKILSKGQVIRSQEMGLLAYLKFGEVHVVKRPVVAVLPTGDELTDDFEVYNNKEHKIINTNSHIISYLIKEVGGVPLYMGVIPDSSLVLKRKLQVALRRADFVITLGGTSAGKKDIVKPTINSMGKPGIISHKIKLDRGRVTGLGVLSGKPILVLPGPIQGALNGFFIFFLPLIKRMLGQTQKDSIVYATLTDSWTARKKFDGFRKVMYVKITKSDSELMAKPIIGETESISLMIKSNGFSIVSEKIKYIEAGKKIPVNLLPGFSYIKNSLFID